MTCMTEGHTDWSRLQSDYLTGSVTLNVSIDAQLVAVSVDSGATFLDATWTGEVAETRGWQVYLTPDLLPPGLTYEVLVRVRDTTGDEPIDAVLPAGTITYAGVSDASPDLGSGAVGVPPGGSTGQVLGKVSGLDYATEWIDQTGDGGSSVTDGVGAVFFGGSSLVVPLTGTRAYCPFIATDDGPRAPQRDDLMTVNADDDTTLDIVRSGLYDISLNTPLRLAIDAAPSAVVELWANVEVEVNGGNEPPSYDYNNRAYWLVEPGSNLHPPIGQNITLPQVLLAGDTLRLAFRVTQSGLETVTGSLHLNPDITLVLTYRGPVNL